MAYTAPNTFVSGTPLDASDLKGNDDALKIYLHEGVINTDLLNSAWVQTRHVQAPVLDAYAGVQHGITGYQGAQWDGGTLVRCQFASSFLTGGQAGVTTATWEVIPQTAFTLDLRRAATVVFHWWMESFNGPDSNSARLTPTDAYLYVADYIVTGTPAATANKVVVPEYQSEVVNNYGGFKSTAPPSGALRPYTVVGYGNLQGTKVFTATNNLTVGLAHISTIERSAIINWGIALEVYYL